MTFTIAIVGRPNVGKSTLFNRLVGKRLALVDDQPGVTRDRREGQGRIAGLEFRLFDTAGLEDADAATMEGRMQRQTETALDDADLALMLIDGRAGVTPLDQHFADWMRRRNKPILLLANKCEGAAGDGGLAESWALGLGEPLPVSAAHGEGLAGLHNAILEAMEEHAAKNYVPPAPAAAVQEDTDTAAEGDDEFSDGIDDDIDGEFADEFEDDGEGDGILQLAILGRPNAGKSTLVNRLLGEERQITGPEPGLTRDSIGTAWQWGEQTVRLIDTAGLRKQARVSEKLEKLAADDAVRAMEYAQVVVLMLDARAPLERQDLSIARRTLEEGRALVVAANKWDLVSDRNAAMGQLRDRLETSLTQARGVPVVTFSALTGRGVEKLMPAVTKTYKCWQTRISTAALNRWLKHMVEAHPPPLGPHGRRIRLRYMTQAKTRPPTFVIFTNLTEDLPAAYERYLQNGLREQFDLPGVPLRFLMRKQDNPYVKGG
ncbi:MAG: ribosome biogenesis GTPase Der [Rhodospirillaceae bacterium]|jgi:GTP-binding protein|nr:ribosome biogenesis GTPase Der [Rhodospirillaceae bacterium]MBT4044899.1 ribosome biogenesis GTPase Der [Rhodospirillaceae bacterium]MBT4688244.1 ribosome biogenesis GTPase Der [Rhodospirillaceae bacterium]MBT5079237.1 ribosome biogenesis GTPase Der [Rhodospirillaceae bacterium]MBT5522479.1 ribosome biogenesis GTPase Der [Rhodospirillaceae bacterium]